MRGAKPSSFLSLLYTHVASEVGNLSAHATAMGRIIDLSCRRGNRWFHRLQFRRLFRQRVARAGRGVVGPHDSCAEHHVARPQEGAHDIVRAIDQACGRGLVGEGGREGIGRLARVDEGLTRASALRDGVGGRRAADLRDGRRLDLDEGKARQSGRLRLAARSDRGRLRLSKRAFCGLVGRRRICGTVWRDADDRDSRRRNPEGSA